MPFTTLVRKRSGPYSYSPGGQTGQKYRRQERDGFVNVMQWHDLWIGDGCEHLSIA